MRKCLLIISILFVSKLVLAPGTGELPIGTGVPVNPFEKLWLATIEVELRGKPDTTITRSEQAYGPGQIRKVRLDDYNQRTGSNYQLTDCFDRATARKIYMYYASKFRPTSIEIIAKAWNGSGPKTEEYWTRIKKALK